MYAAIQSIAPNAAFTLFTGDIVDHAVWLDNESQNIKDINDAYSRMSGLVNVYGTAGNHEAAPANAFPPTALKTTAEQWVFDTLSADWTPWIGATSAAAADQFGAYAIMYGNLKVISINTNLYYKENYYLYEPTMETDPSGQLAWLVSELQDAENNGYRAYIIGHMPMGVGDAFHDGSNYFDQIVNRYSATIAALFFGKFSHLYIQLPAYIQGHTHVDQFEIAYSDYTAQSYSNALEVSYIAPSMTPTSGSPAFRVYTVDPVTFGVLDVTTYIANITSPDYQTTGPVWEEYYSAKSVYGPLVGLTDPAAELTPVFWHNVTVAFENDDAAFQDYETRKSRGYTPGDCTGSCKTSEICEMRAAQSQYNCATITPGINFKRGLDGVGKRDPGVVPGVGECEGSILRPILAKLAANDGLLEEGVVKAQLNYLKGKH
jgi:sphingomyelin phosphodiesterase